MSRILKFLVRYSSFIVRWMVPPADGSHARLREILAELIPARKEQAPLTVDTRGPIQITLQTPGVADKFTRIFTNAEHYENLVAARTRRRCGIFRSEAVAERVVKPGDRIEVPNMGWGVVLPAPAVDEQVVQLSPRGRPKLFDALPFIAQQIEINRRLKAAEHQVGMVFNGFQALKEARAQAQWRKEVFYNPALGVPHRPSTHGPFNGFCRPLKAA